MNFVVLSRGTYRPTSGLNTAYLNVDNWNDHSFVTMFYLTIFDETGNKNEIGDVKIGFKGQTIEKGTYTTLGNGFSLLNDQYFSLGTDVDYYKNLNKLAPELRLSILTALEDIVYKPEKLKGIEDEEVLNTSLFRTVTLSDVHGQFSRVLSGLAELSNFDFNFIRQGLDGF